MEFLEKINLLKRISRMGWLEAGLNPSEAEDVAQHTFITSVITLLLSDSLERDINIERALKISIIHDWAETIIGDFSARVTSLIGKEVKEDIEEKAMEEFLLDKIDNGRNYLKLLKEYSENKTPESQLVHAADRISILVEANYLFKRGENSEKLKKIWRSVRGELETYVDVFPILENLLEDLENSNPIKG